jgi:prepilin-type N-terminal cleavage/methylation domain-containing protein
MFQATKQPPNRRGVTLVEMLVVVTILLMMFAVAAPMIQPAMESTRIREGARLANAAFARARTRAIETGNPVGLVIEPSAANAGASFRLGFAQVPTLFAGQIAASTITVVDNGDDTSTVTFSNPANPGDADEIDEGDLIKFNYQGKKYRVKSKGANWEFTYDDEPVVIDVADAAFQVFKPPFRSIQTMPSQLPDKICIDIAASGLGDGAFAAGQTIIVLFNSAGLIEQVYMSGVAITPTSPIYFLVGNYDSLGTADLGELWVACGHQTGTIITADVAAGADLAAKRILARSMQTKGGR